MIIIMHPEATPWQIDNVVAEVEAKGWQTHRSSDHGQTVIGLRGKGQPLDLFQVGQWPGVLDTMAITQQFKLASRAFCPEDTTFMVRDVPVGGNKVFVIAGPCSVESREQLMETAHAVKAEARLYDHLFTVENPGAAAADEGRPFADYINKDSLIVSEAYLEPYLATLPVDAKVQFERLGYFCVDPDSTEGRRVFNRSVGLRDSWAKIEKKG